ncbi:HEPN/Toprim-associated domain-containing protein [Promicromonospora soli]|uniref:HEPN/Toprim N-terminal domain-containing protein n=1 Tax=Promicromonospora soli TaxID=2035533 RepID=A0A919FRG0_9MICO|nr:HEPN/Toprim-associated domain-containing protein [Promicromonospora soli]GHH70320.1 hypothetical protein GCM10017772_16730 [Promicromonospora soli]
MGSWWSIQVGGQAIPVWGKNYVPDELMLLFADEDRFVDTTKLAALAEYENRAADAPEPDGLPLPWHDDLMGYSATARTLRRRLELQGFSSDWVSRLSTAFFDDEEERRLSTLWQEGTAAYPNGAAITAALTTRSGRAAGAGIRPDPRERPEEHFLHEQWERLREAFDDPRFALALSLCRTRAASEVKLDLTDLVLGGWLTPDENPHREARLRMSATVAADGAVIVVTEGSSDAHRLRRSVEVAAPEVAHLFRFLDFDLRPPGGTDRVVSLTKGMAAAGVMNRIIAVLDNDTAGREAAAQLSKLHLPAQVVAVCLPTAPYANRYPTLGPSGRGAEDVNGRAVSMEFMFGEDVLRNAAGELAPVRWHAFNEKMGDYQGRLDTTDKVRVGERIDAALSVGTSNRVPDQVRTGCVRLARMLIAAADPPQRIPASEGSVLTQMWRRDPFCEIRINLTQRPQPA